MPPREPPRRNRTWPALGLLAWAAVAGLAQEPPARVGTVRFSDGTQLEGRLELTRGKKLSLHTGRLLREFELDMVREIRLAPEKEELVRQWRFAEAGQTRKEFWGDPYPVRHLTATVVLAGGETLEGHLYTTVLYVRGDAGEQKVVLPIKQRGEPGQVLADLVYPLQVRFSQPARPGGAQLRVRLDPGDLRTDMQVVALTRGGLNRLESRPAENGAFLFPSPLGEPIFLATRAAAGLVAGWPAGDDAEARGLVEQAMATDVRDFFDVRQVLGVFSDAESGDLYSLLMLSREGATVGVTGPRDRSWRLEVWRWKHDRGSRRLMVGGRGFFFRDAKAAGEPPPPVTLSARLWDAATRASAAPAEPGPAAPETGR